MSYIGKVSVDGGTTEHLVGSTLYGTCSTAAGTAAKVVTCSDFDVLQTGVTIHVKFTAGSTTMTTMNVNSTGAKPVGNVHHIELAGIAAFTYDGTSWNMNAAMDYDTKNTAGSMNSASKLYLIGATSQAANPTTYSNVNVYEQGGGLYAAGFNGMMIHESTDQQNHTYFEIGSAEALLTIPAGNWRVNEAAGYAVGTVVSGNTGLVTGGDVYTAIQAASAGSLSYGGVVTSEAGLGTTYTAGTYWIVGSVSAGTQIAGQVVEAGDMIIAHADYSGTVANDVDIVQSNVERPTDTDIDAAIAEAEAA